MEHTPGIPKPPNERNSFINCWLGVWGMFQGYVEKLLHSSFHHSQFRDPPGSLESIKKVTRSWEAGGHFSCLPNRKTKQNYQNSSSWWLNQPPFGKKYVIVKLDHLPIWIGVKQHPGRWTAGTYKSPIKRKENDLNQTSMIMFHVNLPGCIKKKKHWKHHQVIWKKNPQDISIHISACRKACVRL